MGESARGEMPTPRDGARSGQRAWDAVQGALALALCVALIVALGMLFNPAVDIPLDGPRRALTRLLVAVALVVFGARAVVFLMRALRPITRV
jgi:hypothetical protein